jgi:hypothetical protein
MQATNSYPTRYPKGDRMARQCLTNCHPIRYPKGDRKARQCLTAGQNLTKVRLICTYLSKIGLSSIPLDQLTSSMMMDLIGPRT